MDEHELERVVQEHEMQRLELKESFGAESLATACAFADASGGCPTKQRLLETINLYAGIKRDALALALGRSMPTVVRLLADLEHEGMIIDRGSKKTGGYYVVAQEDTFSH